MLPGLVKAATSAAATTAPAARGAASSLVKAAATTTTAARRASALSRHLASAAGAAGAAGAAPSHHPYHGGKGNTGSLLRARDAKSKAEASRAASACNAVLDLNERQSCDVELLINGGFSPLDGFMDKRTYESVVKTNRLSDNGLLFGLPVVLDVSRDDIKPGKKVLLRYNGDDIATLDVTERYAPNKPAEALHSFKTTSIEHPGVRTLAMERASEYVAGKVTGLQLPKRVYESKTPEEVRDALPKGVDVVAFQCRNPVHRAHYELFTRALDHSNVGKNGVVLVHPTMGPTQEDDIPGDVRYKTYVVLQQEKPNPRVFWSMLPYSMLLAGPREALQHMLVRKNFGCTHFIIGRDMAGCKSSISGEDFYGPYDAQDFANSVAAELGMKTVPSLNLVHVQGQGYVTADVAEKSKWKVDKLSGTEFRRRLRAGEEIPPWFAFESVVKVLRKEWK